MTTPWPDFIQRLITGDRPKEIWRVQHTFSQAYVDQFPGNFNAVAALTTQINEAEFATRVRDHLLWGHRPVPSCFLSVLDNQADAIRWGQDRWRKEGCQRVQLCQFATNVVQQETIVLEVDELRARYNIAAQRDTSHEYLVVNVLPRRGLIRKQDIAHPTAQYALSL